MTVSVVASRVGTKRLRFESRRCPLDRQDADRGSILSILEHGTALWLCRHRLATKRVRYGSKQQEHRDRVRLPR